jgi:hypothetical protein
METSYAILARSGSDSVMNSLEFLFVCPERGLHTSIYFFPAFQVGKPPLVVRLRSG